MMKGWKASLVILTFIAVSWSPAISAEDLDYIPDHVVVNVKTYRDMIKIDVRIPNFNFHSIHLSEGDFTEIELPGEGYTTEIGKAKLPAIRRMVEIPYGAEPVIKNVIIDWYHVFLAESSLSEMIKPCQPSLRKDVDHTPEFVINTTFYNTNSFVPSDVVRIVQTGEIRGHRYAMIEIIPIQYNPVLGEVRLMRSCNIEIDLPGADIEKTVKMEKRYSSPSFEPILKNLLLNYNVYSGDDGDSGKDSTDVEGYLIIVYDSFYDEIVPFANWKEDLGFDVTVTKTSEIPGGPTKENIKSYIENAYYNWPIPPSYVLLVGDVSQIPTWTGSACGSATDQYYVDVDDDPFADIHIGRFPAATDSQVTVMVEKTECYVDADFPDDNYVKRAAFMASEDNYWISEGTHNYVISNYLEPNDFSSDKLYCHTYDATTQDVRDALNDGRGLAIYSGHGSETAWVDGPYFDQGDVNSLTNSQMYPFVCSHACLTGKFTVAECFGETWLRAPSKGGFAFWGSSTYTYWDEDDVLEKKMFKAWWEDNIETIGGMTDMAKYYLYQYYGGGGRSQYYLECYNLLGDPSVKLWRTHPLRADFNWSPEYPHPNEFIYFFDASTNAEAWSWDFGDGTTSHERNPVHVYASEGIYDVTLTVYGSGGRTDRCTKRVAVYENWPPIAIAHPEQYAGNNPTVHFDGSDSWDPDGAIVSYFWDFRDGNTSTEVSPTHTFGKDGIYNVTLTVIDNGGKSSTAVCDIKIDVHTPPVTTIAIEGLSGNEGWYISPIRVILNASDWSGVDYTKYNVDGGAWKTYTGPFPFFTPGEHVIGYYSVDIWGNVEPAHYETVKIDTEKPELHVDISGEQINGWYVTATITCNASDKISGLKAIYYRLEEEKSTTDVEWNLYTEPITLTEDGSYIFRAYAEDVAGNTFGKMTPHLINIDNSPPQTTCSFEGIGSGGNYYKNVTIILTATDAGIGVNSTFYRLDGGDWKTYTGPILVDTLGSHTIEYYSVDNLGHEESVHSLKFNVTNINFNLEITNPKNGLYIFGRQTLLFEKTIIIGGITIKAELEPYDPDVPPEYDSVIFYIDGKKVKEFTSPPFEWSWEGSAFGKHTITVRATNDGDYVEKSMDVLIFKIL